MRALTLALGLGLAVSGLTAGHPAATAAPSPGEPILELQPVPGSDLRSLDVPLSVTTTTGARAARGPLRTTAFSMLGLTWHGAAAPRILVRTHTAEGWTRWRAVPLLTDLPDSAVEGRRGLRATPPWWVGPADGGGVRVQGSVRDLELALIDPGRSPAPGAGSTPPHEPSGRTVSKPGKHKPKK